MRKTFFITAGLFWVGTSLAQVVIEYATVSTNFNMKKKSFSAFSEKTLEWFSKEKKNVKVKQVISVLNELSLQGWFIHSAYASIVGQSHLSNRKVA